MTTDASRIRASLVIASLAALSAATAFAEGAPPGIYSITRRLPPPFYGLETVYTGLSGDGSIVRSERANQIWTYPDGPGAFFPTGSPTLSTINDASPDMEILLGRRDDGRSVVTTRDRSWEWVPEYSSPYGIYPSAMSPDGRFVAGNGSYLGPNGLQLDAGRWNVDDGFRVLDRAPDLAATEVVGVTNDGTVYGHGYIRRDPRDPHYPIVQDRAIRWNPDGTLETLAGTDGEGFAWKEVGINDLSPDGSFRVGWGVREVPSGNAGSLAKYNFAAVFDESGIAWTVEDERFGSIGAYRLGVTSDGELAYGHQLGFSSNGLSFDSPKIWTRDGGRVDFEVFLRSMGIDTAGWNIESIIDMSDDGKSFLVYGNAIGSDRGQLLIVVPEPGAAVLLGLGLVGLTLGRSRAAHSRSRLA